MQERYTTYTKGRGTLIKGIIFDLDGTLLDRDRSLLAFLDNQYNRIHAVQKLKSRFSSKDSLN